MSMMLKTGLKLFETLSEGKPHSSITDWVDILTGDNYALDELDGVAELVEAVDIQGATGPDEASRAIRKKLKYGSVHRQIRALTLLKSLSENSRTFPKSFVSSPQLLDRLRETAKDYHTDPDVKRRLMGVLKGWKVQHDEGDRAFSRVAGMWAELGGGGAKRASTLPAGSSGAAATKPPATRDEGLWDHSWDVSPAAAAASRQSSKAEEAQRQLDASARRAEAERAKLVNDAKERERREMERRERELADREERVKREERMLAARKKNGGASLASAHKAPKAAPKRPPFNFEKEKPAILTSVAGASQAANNLINAIRLVNRETESITTNARVQKYLEEAKTLRKRVIRYIQLVEDEEYIGTLLQTNETIITALQLYDKMAKPATHDSDDEAPTTAQTVNPNEAKTEEEALGLKMAAQRLQDERASELAKLQAKQRHAVRRDQLRRGNSAVGSIGSGGASSSNAAAHPDLQDLDFGGSRGVAPPLDNRYGNGGNDAHDGRYNNDSLSDLSDYDSSDDDYRLRSAAASRRQSVDQSSAYSANTQDAPYGNLLDTPAADDPFADPFFGEGPATPMAKERKEWTSV